MNQKEAEAAHVWHCGSGSPPATRAAVFSSTNNERNGECLHLCDRFIVIACQSVALCVCVCVYVLVFFPKYGEVVVVFSLFHGVLLLGNCLYASEFQSADGNGSAQPTHLHLFSVKATVIS